MLISSSASTEHRRTVHLRGHLPLLSPAAAAFQTPPSVPVLLLPNFAAMSLMSAGMATMYLNERLSFGMAPDDIAGVFTQRLRWCVLSAAHAAPLGWEDGEPCRLPKSLAARKHCARHAPSSSRTLTC